MKRFLVSVALGICAATQASAVDLADLSDTDRDAFRDEVRAYLLENPEIIMEAIQVLKDRDTATEAQNDLTLVQENSAALFTSSTDWVGGNKDGDITIVEFMDYRCSYCKKAHDEVSDLIKSDGNIRFILKEFPILGEQSDLASRFAISIRQIGGDATYKAAHDALLSMRAEINAASLDALAAKLGLDPAVVNARMQTPEVSAVIATNRALAEKMLINGTPTFIVQKTMLRGYVPLDGMREVVADARKG
jgi:protein-disulfide isomerase